MHPVLFELFGFPVPTFGMLVALAFLAAFTWIYFRAKDAGENPEIYVEMAPWAILSAIVGARFCYLIFFPDVFFADPLGSLLNKGGLVWYGGVVGVVTMMIVYTRVHKLEFWRFSDIIVPPAALGLAIGRLGCFMAGCCFGGPCALPWAVQYPHGHPTHPALVHPAPLYESLAVLVLVLIMNYSYKTQKVQGQTGWIFIIGYGVIRFFMEYVRGDRLVWSEGLNLSASQFISLAAIVIGTGFIVWLHKRSEETVESIT